MTACRDIDLPAVLAERLTTCHLDVLRELLATFIDTLMGAEADALCGAGYGERSSARINQRDGYRQRRFDTCTGTVDLAIPKLRQGSCFPGWLLERRNRAERTLTTVVATCCLLGVSTRRMDKLVETLGITGLSTSQVVVGKIPSTVQGSLIDPGDARGPSRAPPGSMTFVLSTERATIRGDARCNPYMYRLRVSRSQLFVDGTRGFTRVGVWTCRRITSSSSSDTSGN